MFVSERKRSIALFRRLSHILSATAKRKFSSFSSEGILERSGSIYRQLLRSETVPRLYVKSKSLNKKYLSFILRMQNLLSWHYPGGSYFVVYDGTGRGL